MRITVIGLGLIGGSMAIDLKKRGFAEWVTGVDNNQLHAEAALHIGLVDEVSPLGKAIDTSDLIILATPADVTARLLPQILDKVDRQTVTDTGSTKELLCQVTKYHPKRPNYVAAHPMAGTEFSGPWAALPGLFDGKAVIFCDAEESGAKALENVRRMFDTLNMRPVYMNSSSHDRHAAYVSHISHISSFALALTVLDQEKNEKHIFDLASGGFSSTVRLAKSSAEMWTPVFTQNTENVIKVLDTYIEKLTEFREAIKTLESDKITELILKANKIKKIL